MMPSVTVSAIMPTADRRAFIGGAIAAFVAQTSDSAELIVLDDGADPVADLAPGDPRIRYERLPARLPLGAKRNRLCEMAKGRSSSIGTTTTGTRRTGSRGRWRRWRRAGRISAGSTG